MATPNANNLPPSDETSDELIERIEECQTALLTLTQQSLENRQTMAENSQTAAETRDQITSLRTELANLRQSFQDLTQSIQSQRTPPVTLEPEPEPELNADDTPEIVPANVVQPVVPESHTTEKQQRRHRII
jgi:chromosome segregation ATPase